MNRRLISILAGLALYVPVLVGLVWLRMVTMDHPLHFSCADALVLSPMLLAPLGGLLLGLRELQGERRWLVALEGPEFWQLEDRQR